MSRSTPREAEEMAAHHCSACLEIGRIRGQLVWALEHVLNERLTYYDYQEAQWLLGQICEDCP